MAAVLGVSQSRTDHDRDLDRRLVGRSRQLLFDDCEHLRDAAADLVDGSACSAAVRSWPPAASG